MAPHLPNSPTATISLASWQPYETLTTTENSYTLRTFRMSLENLVTISPSTNKPILERTGLSQEDLLSLPAVAHKAFKAFRNDTSLQDRQQIVKKALQLLGDKKDELAQELTEQMGRPIAYTAKEITTAVARGEYLLKISDDALADTDGETEKGFKRYIKKVPVGPVLVLFAWNVSTSSSHNLTCHPAICEVLSTFRFPCYKHSIGS
jgi:acyl-CoA reductase-like NAD-dependent aldehyde dehydrogenase